MKSMKIFLISTLIIAIVTPLVAYVLPAQIDASMNQVTKHASWPVSAQARILHDSMIIGDWHSDSLLWNRDFLKANDYGHVDLPRLQQGNVAFQVLTAVTKTPAGMNYQSNSSEAHDKLTALMIAQTWPIRTWRSIFERALYQVERLQDLQKRAPEEVRHIKTKQDIQDVIMSRSTNAPLTGLLMGMEGAHPLEGKLENLDRLYDAGYRLIGLQHFFDNELGGSLHGQSNLGLTDFGKQVVQAASDKNMIIDVAHSSHETVRDVLAIMNRPVVLSHTGIHEICQTKRNIPGKLMEEIANVGGVIGIGYWAEVVCDNTPKGIVKAIKAGVNLLGVNHISLGSDYDGTIESQFDTSELAALTHEMLQQGFTSDHIKKIMGGNMLRVMNASLK
ncbi:MAG: microsomal dipeptidase-like Zn-dependent dipeptidase [Bermanella sp.]|jgi:membrane dipeptidase